MSVNLLTELGDNTKSSLANSMHLLAKECIDKRLYNDVNILTAAIISLGVPDSQPSPQDVVSTSATPIISRYDQPSPQKDTVTNSLLESVPHSAVEPEPKKATEDCPEESQPQTNSIFGRTRNQFHTAEELYLMRDIVIKVCRAHVKLTQQHRITSKELVNYCRDEIMLIDPLFITLSAFEDNEVPRWKGLIRRTAKDLVKLGTFTKPSRNTYIFHDQPLTAPDSEPQPEPEPEPEAQHPAVNYPKLMMDPQHVAVMSSISAYNNRHAV